MSRLDKWTQISNIHILITDDSDVDGAQFISADTFIQSNLCTEVLMTSDHELSSYFIKDFINCEILLFYSVLLVWFIYHAIATS